MVVDPTRGLEFVQKSAPDTSNERKGDRREAAPSRRMRLDAATREAIRKAQETRKKPRSAAVVESVQDIRREAAQAHVEIPQQLNAELQQQQADALQVESAFLDSFKLNKNLPEGAPKKKLNKVVTMAELRSLRQFEKSTELVRTAATDEGVRNSADLLREQIKAKRTELEQLQGEADKLSKFSLSSVKREQARVAREAVLQAQSELDELYQYTDGESQTSRIAKKQLRDLRDKRAELVQAQNRKEATRSTRDRLVQRGERATLKEFMSGENRLRSMFGSLADIPASLSESLGSADSKYEKWSEAFEAEERVPVVREQYDAAVAEVVGDSQMAFIEEQIALTQDVIAERSGTDASLYKRYYDQVGSTNLEHVLGVEAGDGFFSQLVLRAVTVDRWIKFGLTSGIGLSAGVTGAGFAVAGVLGMRAANGAMFYARSLDSQKQGQLRGAADGLLRQENTDADIIEKMQQLTGAVGSGMMKLLRKLRGEPHADPRPAIADMSNDQLLASIGDMLAWSETSGTRLASNVFKEHKPLGGKENRVLTPAEVLQALLEEYGSRLEQVRTPEGLIFVAEQVEGQVDNELTKISALFERRRVAASDREPMMKLIAGGSAAFGALVAPQLFNAAREMAADGLGMAVDVVFGTEANAATFGENVQLTDSLLHADSTVEGAGVHDRPYGPFDMNIRFNGNAYEAIQAAGYRGFNSDGYLVFENSTGAMEVLQIPYIAGPLTQEGSNKGWLPTENMVLDAQPDGTVVLSAYDEAGRLQASASGNSFEEINAQFNRIKEPYAHESVGAAPVDTVTEDAATVPVRTRRSVPTSTRPRVAPAGETAPNPDAGTVDESGRFVPSYMSEPKPGSSLDFDDPDFSQQLKDEGLLVEKEQKDISKEDMLMLQALEGIDDDLAADDSLRRDFELDAWQREREMTEEEIAKLRSQGRDAEASQLERSWKEKSKARIEGMRQKVAVQDLAQDRELKLQERESDLRDQYEAGRKYKEAYDARMAGIQADEARVEDSIEDARSAGNSTEADRIQAQWSAKRTQLVQQMFDDLNRQYPQRVSMDRVATDYQGNLERDLAQLQFDHSSDYDGEWSDYQSADQRSRNRVTWDNPADAPERMERVQDPITNANPKDPESVKAIAKILREDRQARTDAQQREKFGTGDYDDLDKSTGQLRREARRRAIPEALQGADKKLADAQERVVMGGDARFGEDYQADQIARTQRIEQFRDGNNAQINFGESVDSYSLGSSTELLGKPTAKVEFAPGSARDSVELYGDWNALVDQNEAEQMLLKDNWESRIQKGLQVRDQNGSVVAERPQAAIDAIIAEKRQEVLRLARLRKIQELMYEQGLDKEYDPARINSDDPRLKLQKTSEYRAVQKEIRQLERALNDSAPILKE